MSHRDGYVERVTAFFLANPDQLAKAVSECAVCNPQPETPMPPSAPVAAPQQPVKSTFGERRLAAIKLFEERPDLHPDEACTLLRARFGQAVAAQFVYALARDAREEAGLEQLPTRSAPGAQPTAKRSLDLEGLPAIEALKAVAVALKGIPDMDAMLTLKGGQVSVEYSLIATGKLEV